MTDDIRELVEPEPKPRKTININALISGITGLLTYLIMALPVLTDFNWILSIVLAPISAFTAIIIGHKSKKQISNNEGTMSGKKLANTGLMLGYIYFALVILVLVLVIAGVSWIINALGGVIS